MAAMLDKVGTWKRKFAQERERLATAFVGQELVYGSGRMKNPAVVTVKAVWFDTEDIQLQVETARGALKTISIEDVVS